MSKSIEEQREELAEKYVSLSAPEVTRLQMSWDFKNGFDAGVKSRDAEWLKVVNELRESMIFIHKKVGSCAYGQNDKWGCEMESVYRSSQYALTKADQMLKDMGVKL